MEPDWQQWHREYDDPVTNLSQRLEIVRRHIRTALDGFVSGNIRAVSICAGQAHDVIGALANHPRRADVHARLVEIQPRSVELARRAAQERGLSNLEFVCGDASVTDAYAGAVPAHLVLCCGVFGNLSLADVERTIETLPQLCGQGATVIWTRHRRAPDRTPEVRRLFANHGFRETAYEETDRFGVGVAQLEAAPQALVPGTRMFDFGSGFGNAT